MHKQSSRGLQTSRNFFMKEVFKKIIYFLFDRHLIRKGKPGGIYLTYDDGPHPENTEKILDVLSNYKVKATFFMIGAQMEQFPDIVNAVISQGHTVGYHSYQHKSLKKKSFREIRNDFIHAGELSDHFKYPIKLYRPPYGDLSILSFFWLFLHGWKITMWSLDCRDSFDSPGQVKANIGPEKIEDGEIILLHDDYGEASELIEATLALYKDHGITCRQL